MLGIGFIGDGAGFRAVARTLSRAGDVRLVAVAGRDPVRTRASADAAGIPLALTPEALLERDDVVCIVDLAPVRHRHDRNLRALAAGKLVFSAWPLAPTAELARQQCAVADGVLAGAPDTFLGEGWQTVRAALDQGAIGRPIAVVAHVLPGPDAAGMANALAHTLTALIASFGAVAAVEAGLGRTWPTPTHDLHGATILLRFASGVIATLLLGVEPPAGLPAIEVFGDVAALALPDPRHFDGPVRIRGDGDAPWRSVEAQPGFVGDAFGVGVLDLLAARRERRPPRADAARCAHVLEVMEAMHAAHATPGRFDVTGRCERPLPLGIDDVAALGVTPGDLDRNDRTHADVA